MFDLASIDPRLLFPNMNELLALFLELAMASFDLSLTILVVIVEWMIFKKLGEKPWKSLIPFYSMYILYKNVWSKSAFWVYLAGSVGFSLLYGASELLTGFYPGSIWVSILVLLAIPFGITEVVSTILYSFRLGEAFGKGRGFGFGLIFLYAVFAAVLGFGKARYIGNDEATETEAPVPETEAEQETV